MREASIHVCSACKKVIARQDGRRKNSGHLALLSGAKLMLRKGEAPRLRCSCGKVMILLSDFAERR